MLLPEQEILKGDSFCADIFANNELDLATYSIIEDGLSLQKDINFNENALKLNLIHDIGDTQCYFKITLYFTDNISVTLQIFGKVYDDCLYLSQYSYEEATMSYIQYLKQYDVLKFNEYNSNIMPLNDSLKPDNYTKVNQYYSELANTYVEGTFRWVDDKNAPHPLQYNLVQLWDKEPIGERLIMESYTDENGFFRFSFKNEDDCLSFENGGYDVFVRLVPAGRDVRVLRGNSTEYYEDLGYYQNISTGTTHCVSSDYPMKDINNHDILFNQALQVNQSLIIQSMFFEEISGNDAKDLTCFYPHSEKKNGCFYRNSNDSIYITGPNQSLYQSIQPYSSWDVLMHEYSHHMCYELGLVNSPGGGHFVNTSMGEHYKLHFTQPNQKCFVNCALQNNPNSFSETECKIKGLSLAWSEGLATFLGQIGQEYYSSLLNGIDFINDFTYTSYNGCHSNLETFTGKTEDCENTVQSILYDLYDSNISSLDNESLAIDFNSLMNLIISSHATTFYDFYNYFRNNYTHFKAYSSLIGSLLELNGLICSKPLTNKVKFDSPTFSWIFHDNAILFKNKEFSLNFYDQNFDLIDCSKTTQFCNIKVNDSLWTKVLNSGEHFFVSVTMIEKTDYSTKYESEWTRYCIEQPKALRFNDEPKISIAEGEYHWFSFVSPQANTFHFESFGDTDTYGELFSFSFFWKHY